MSNSASYLKLLKLLVGCSKMWKNINIAFFILMTPNFVCLLPRPSLYIRPNTLENVHKLKHLGPNDLAELYGGQFEGDMVLTPRQLNVLNNNNKDFNDFERTGLIDVATKWPNNTVPYTLEKDVFWPDQVEFIERALKILMNVTCIKFVKYNPKIHSNYILVTGNEYGGCYSYIGMKGGVQELNLDATFYTGYGCFRLHSIAHEFIHALGFYHMQCASERDDYVKILWENVVPGREKSFEKRRANVISQFGVEYDYGSIMHYPSTSFSRNGLPTIRALESLNGEVMGQRSKLTDKDITRINNKYC